ncbi:MAG: response regulator [Candidatus Hodarchaeales archaeon]
MARNLTRRILLVDDSKSHSKVIKDRLKSSKIGKFRVFTSKSSDNALNLLESNNPPLFSLILLEVASKKYNRFELLKQIKNDSSPYKIIPVVIFSKIVDLKKIKDCLLLGANSFIKKPSMSDYHKILDTIIEFWFVHASLPSELE